MSEDYLIYLFLQLHHYLFPFQGQRNEPQRDSGNQNQVTTIPGIRHRRRNRYSRFYNRYRRINLGDNHTRGNIILRARQITQQNQQVAVQAEQAFVDAILQARDEQAFFTSHAARVAQYGRVRLTRTVQGAVNNPVDPVDPADHVAV